MFLPANFYQPEVEQCADEEGENCRHLNDEG